MLEALKTGQMFSRIGLDVTNFEVEVGERREERTFGHLLLFPVI